MEGLLTQRPAWGSETGLRRTYADNHPLAVTIDRLSHLSLHCRLWTVVDSPSSWLTPAALVRPEEDPLRHLLAQFQKHELAVDRRGAAASFMLRLGWSCGFAIGSFLLDRRVPILNDMALHFHDPYLFLDGVWIQDFRFIGATEDTAKNHPNCIRTLGEADLLKELLIQLRGFAEPVVDSQHRWSGFSKRVLWAMVTSSWAAQFANLMEQLGNWHKGLEWAEAMFSFAPDLRRAFPKLYAVESAGKGGVCQSRAGCCLYFKAPGAEYCASCPILPEEVRLARNREWVARK